MNRKISIKKLFKIILLIIVLIWVGLEIFIFISYIKIKNNRQEAIHQFKEERLINPQAMGSFSLTSGPIIYRPVILRIFYPMLERMGVVEPIGVYKPVIYLYPISMEEIQVKLDYQGTIFADYPEYDDVIKGWNVTAYPDGKIINSDGKEYSYLFWEGISRDNPNYDLTTGFVIKGEDTVEFLQTTLSKLGLTPKEYNEFIVYWYPQMKDNKYNLIHFAKEEYTNTAPLTIIPKPDSMLRVFMVFKSLNKMIDVNPQEIKSFDRNGFSVIEWGGTEIK